MSAIASSQCLPTDHESRRVVGRKGDRRELGRVGDSGSKGGTLQ